MHHSPNMLDTMIRPRILVTAARHALQGYGRDRELRRLLRIPLGAALPGPRAAHSQLLRREATVEAWRSAHDGRWRAAEHVALICALIAEARVISPQPRENTPHLRVASVNNGAGGPGHARGQGVALQGAAG